MRVLTHCLVEQHIEGDVRIALACKPQLDALLLLSVLNIEALKPV